jgi:tripartite-type tricarboxylate transporter receptor subunit TctC
MRRAHLLLACLGLLAAAPAAAQPAWPERSVRILVPSAPGDAGDTLGRIIGAEFERLTGRSFIVENRAGAGGRIASEATARAVPDGHTLMIANAGSHGITAALHRSLPYDVVRDFAPISLLLEAPSVLVVNRRTLPVDDLAGFIAAVRAAPGGLPYASGGVGGSAHMSMELFRARTGLLLEHVPFRGAGGALTALTAGEPAVMFVNLPTVLASLRRGELQPLAVTSLSRAPELPLVPTVDEAGVPGFETIAWFGLVAPAAVPAPVIAAISRLTERALQSPEVQARMQLAGGTPRASSAEAFAQRIAADVALWRRVVAERGLAVE